MVSKGEYLDFRDDEFYVFGIVKNIETKEDLVVFQKKGTDKLKAMSLTRWNTPIILDGKQVPRFTKIKNDAGISKSKTTYIPIKSINSKDYVSLYKTITNYLLSVVPSGITQAKLNEYFVSYKCKNFEDLCICFFSTLQDYQFFPKVVGFNNPSRRPIFKKILMNYNHKKILDKYDENSLFEEFCNNFPVKNKESKQNSWRRYAASIISACNYLSQFSDINEYNDYCESFKGSQELPDKMKNNIKGMGFALACNLLKDTGFMDYSKPDVHLKDVLAGTGYCGDDDYSVFNCVREIAEANNVKAFEVDSKIWLSCSGSYYKHGINTAAHKDGLIQAIRSI